MRSLLILVFFVFLAHHYWTFKFNGLIERQELGTVSRDTRTNNTLVEVLMPDATYMVEIPDKHYIRVYTISSFYMTQFYAVPYSVDDTEEDIAKHIYSANNLYSYKIH